MDLVGTVESVAVVLTCATFFMGVPAAVGIAGKKRAEPGEIIGFTIGLALSLAWSHVGYYSPNMLSSLQIIGLLINGACMFVFFLFTDDKSIVAKHVGAILAMHLGLIFFASNVAPSKEWAEGGVFAFALTLNFVIGMMPLLSINDVKRHQCTYPMGMDLKSSLLLFALNVAWGLHAFLVGDFGGFVFSLLMTGAWGVVVYYNLIFPFNPPSGLKKD